MSPVPSLVKHNPRPRPDYRHGLLVSVGTSLALALRSGGVEVFLRDSSPTAGRLAQDLGAGTLIGRMITGSRRW